MAAVCGGDVWKVKYIVVGEGELKEWVRTCWSYVVVWSCRVFRGGGR